MHFYCTTDFAEIHCSCGFRGFGQGHRHQRDSFSTVSFLFAIFTQNALKWLKQ